MSLQADQYVVEAEHLSLDVYICGACGHSEFSLPEETGH